MQDPTALKAQYGTRVAALTRALDDGDESGFLAVLDDMLHTRQPGVFSELRELTCNLQVALERFRIDARLADLAEKDIPDAHQRLGHVLQMTDEAAHRTLDLVEQAAPPAARSAQVAAALARTWASFRAHTISVQDYRKLLVDMDEFLPDVKADCELIRHNLAEVLLTQGYQDLTGQIIRGVMQLVQELETTLAELSRLSGADSGAAPQAPPRSNGNGPYVPGVTQGEVAAGQQDVDALLSGLGM